MEEKNSLKSLLHTRANEYKMLSNTLCEIMERNPSSKAIHMFKDEMDEVLNEIASIKKSLNSFGDSDNEYGYYNDEDKSWFEENEKKSIYDSIEKTEEKKGRCVGSCGSCLKKTAEKIREENLNVVDLNDGGLSQDLIEEFRKTADARILSNRFLVDFKDALGVPEIMVKSVAFDTFKKELCIDIYDFVAKIGMSNMPLLELLKHAPQLFEMNIKHLEADGNILYLEKYNGCTVTEVYRYPLDYSNNGFSKISIFIAYKDVEYEAN